MQTIVGVLRGGPSHEHDVSLESGAAILAHLPEDGFSTRDIYIDRKGQWHHRGKITTPDRILRQLDVALVGLHGEYGEDGQVQRLLERFNVPYAGSDSFSSARAMHKIFSKKHAQEAGLRTPNFIHVERKEDAPLGAHDAIRSFAQPVVIKPVGWGSSVGISIVGGYTDVLSAIEKLFDEGVHSVLVEEYIRGKEATVAVIEGLRGEMLYTPPVVEIIPPAGDFFSYDSKYSGTTREVCPGNFSRVNAEELQHLARVMHRELGLRDYSRSDFIVTPQGIYYLETNTLPGLTSDSLFPKALSAVGVSLSEFFAHLVKLAHSR